MLRREMQGALNRAPTVSPVPPRAAGGIERGGIVRRGQLNWILAVGFPRSKVDRQPAESEIAHLECLLRRRRILCGENIVGAQTRQPRAEAVRDKIRCEFAPGR